MIGNAVEMIDAILEISILRGAVSTNAAVDGSLHLYIVLLDIVYFVCSLAYTALTLSRGTMYRLVLVVGTTHLMD